LNSANSINRRTRGWIFTAASLLSLAVWLAIAAAEVYTPLHAWLHGGKVPLKDDDCAIVTIAHGKIETAVCAAPVAVPVTWIEVSPRIEISVYSPHMAFLPDGRGPPVALFHS
jgi:hypothetical protein